MDWSEFIIAFLAFFATHSIPLRPEIKPILVRAVGSTGLSIGYSILSLVVFYWLLMAAGRAPFVEVWSWEPWQNHVPLVGMFIAIWLAVMSLGHPNPFSFGGSDNDAFAPETAGIVKWTRHPLLIAILIWSAAHTIPNGNLAHLSVFLSFASFSVMGMRIIDRRKQKQITPEIWSELAYDTKHQKGLLPGIPIDDVGVRFLITFAVYAILMSAHAFLFGVSPIS